MDVKFKKGLNGGEFSFFCDLCRCSNLLPRLIMVKCSENVIWLAFVTWQDSVMVKMTTKVQIMHLG